MSDSSNVTAASVAELPFVDALLDVAERDLESSRGLVQRLLAIDNALLATVLTIASLFAGFAVSSKRASVVLIAVPLALTLGYVNGANWVHFGRASLRVRSVEHLFDAYIVVLRETGTVRPQAVQDLRRRVDEYQFGTETTFRSVTWGDVWLVNRHRLMWWLHSLIALGLALCALFFTQEPKADAVCMLTANGGIAQLNAVPSPVVDSVTLVPCPTINAPPSVGSTSTSSAAPRP